MPLTRKLRSIGFSGGKPVKIFSLGFQLINEDCPFLSALTGIFLSSVPSLRFHKISIGNGWENSHSIWRVSRFFHLN